jgi:putative glutamine amidotransferase
MNTHRGVPTIGVTQCSHLDDYIASVEQAGARARVLEVSESPRKVLGEIDGLLLTGGGDVDPVLYGQDRHPLVEDAEPGRDEFELDLARRAIGADLPVLAICRGAQVLNVAAGGTLIQDIPSTVVSDVSHSIKEPRDAVAHSVRVAPGSRLEQALGAAVDAAAHLCRVNSRHHQSIDRLGSGLVSSATSPDGVVEAIERVEAGFCVGVQWHPENFWRTGEFAPLFQAFVKTARERQVARLGGGEAEDA